MESLFEIVFDPDSQQLIELLQILKLVQLVKVDTLVGKLIVVVLLMQLVVALVVEYLMYLIAETCCPANAGACLC
jgi:hypothetical protein